VDDVAHLRNLQRSERKGVFVTRDVDRGAIQHRLAAFLDVAEGNKRGQHVLDSEKEMEA
jgi:hypothetical protein